MTPVKFTRSYLNKFNSAAWQVFLPNELHKLKRYSKF